jgi:chemotaxis protein CheD
MVTNISFNQSKSLSTKSDNIIIVGIGDYAASNIPGKIIKTFSLGSCIAGILLDPKTRTVGMIHFALPYSKIQPQKASQQPEYFADTGIPRLLREMTKIGCKGNGRGMLLKLAGGANVLDPSRRFNIGPRNIQAAKQLFSHYGLIFVSEDIGGTISRTVSVELNTGKVILSTPSRPDWTI